MCDDQNHNSSFIFGLFFGAIIGAIVAIYVYRHSQSKVIRDLKQKLKRYFSDFTASAPSPKTTKKSVTLPKNIAVVDLKPVPHPKPRKMFKNK